MRILPTAIALVAIALAAVTPTHATFEGRNGRLLYQQKVGEHEQLFSVRPDGSDPQQLTDFAHASAINASWSPDGTKIAFVLYAKNPERWRIYTMNADGSLKHQLERRYRLAVAWMPDSRHLLVLRKLRWTIVTSNGVSPRDAGVPGWGDTPCVFGDGKRVAFTTERQKGGTAIFVGRIGGGPGTLKRITPWQSMADKIDCSPDGSKLVFSKPDFGFSSSNVYVIGAEGGGLRQLTHSNGNGINNGANSWSPDGRKISFVSNRARDGVFRVYTMDLDGSHVTQVTRGNGDEGRSSWGSRP
jgi:Tol biopolymer transport system component